MEYWSGQPQDLLRFDLNVWIGLGEPVVRDGAAITGRVGAI